MSDIVIMNPPGLDDAEDNLRRVTEACDKVATCIDIYIEHAIRDRWAPKALMAVVDEILAAKYGRVLWVPDRNRLHARAYRAAEAMTTKPRRGTPAHPPQILDEAVDTLAREAHDKDGEPYSDSAGAYTTAAQRLREDFGLRISASAIRAHHQKRRRG